MLSMNGDSRTDKSGMCEHFAGIDENEVNPNTKSCQECEKEDRLGSITNVFDVWSCRLL